MAAVTLRGPFRLVSDVIGQFVPPGVPGVYVLGAVAPGDLHPVDVVGRADLDLAPVLLGLVGSNSGFMFAPATTTAEAFDLECRLYHQFMLTGLRPHPQAPKDSALACPICGLQG
jgi:hypothetical protein